MKKKIWTKKEKKMSHAGFEPALSLVDTELNQVIIRTTGGIIGFVLGV